MTKLMPLVQNEVLKVFRKKRFYVVLLILVALIPMFTYAQMRQAQQFQKQAGTADWRTELSMRIADYQRSIGSARVPEEWKEWRRIQIQKDQYHLDKNVNPNEASGLVFTQRFLENAINLFIPLMVMVIASDLVSGEHTAGTIKLLLTRPVRRWRILTSKLIAMVLFTSLIVAATGVFSYLISGLAFGYGGWSLPTFTGFRIEGSQVDIANVHVVPLWQYVLMEMGLVWIAALVVGILSVMISVLIRSTAAGMGMMLAVLIAGTILTNMASSWETARYFFMVNMQLTDYLSGSLPPVAGMSLPFSLTVLGLTALAALVVSYAIFTKKDILN